MTERDPGEVLRNAYSAFNDRNIDAGTALMAADVTWPNVADGGFVHGRDAVREHWREQFDAVDPWIDFLGLDASEGDGLVRASVRQVVRSKEGETISDEALIHVFTFRDGLIHRMEVAE